MSDNCEHEIEFQGLCAACGQDMNRLRFLARRRGDELNDTSHVAHTEQGIVIKKSVGKKLSSDQRKKLLASKKLALVLDLDKTLLHATTSSRASAIVGNVVIDWKAVGESGDSSTLPIDAVNVVVRFVLDGTNYFVKFRPGLKRFLRRSMKRFELSIFTAGSRPYAQAIASILDPEQTFFGTRIVSRDDISSIWKQDNQVFKSLERIFPFDDTFAIVLDDSPGVWTGNLDNLVQVYPYTYFKGMRDVNVFANTSEATNPKFAAEGSSSKGQTSRKPLPPALTPIEADALGSVQAVFPPIDGATASHAPPARKLRNDHRQLDSLGRVLREAHRRFFARRQTLEKLSVKPILRDLRSRVFEGVCVCFSGVLRRFDEFNRHPMVMLVEHFGGSVKPQIDETVTHLVATNWQTEKVRQARSRVGIFIVTPQWIGNSVRHYNRQNEAAYPLKNTPHLVTDDNKLSTPVDSDEDAVDVLLRQASRKRPVAAVSSLMEASPEPKRSKPLAVSDDFLDDIY